MPLDPQSQQYVTINTHRGLHRYKRLPFGTASSPAIFQRSMDIILQRLDYVACIQYDVLISGSDDNSHLRNLKAVLQRLDTYGLRLKQEKCKFMQTSVTYMGNTLTAKGISPTEEKVKAIKETPTPQNTTQLRSFLGLLNYHGRFIPNLSTTLYPLNQLVRKDQPWNWTQDFNKPSRSPRQLLHPLKYWSTLTSTSQSSWNVTSASTGLESWSLTDSPMDMRDRSHMLPANSMRRRRTIAKFTRRRWLPSLAWPNSTHTCMVEDSHYTPTTNHFWKSSLLTQPPLFLLQLACNAGPSYYLRTPMTSNTAVRQTLWRPIKPIKPYQDSLCHTALMPVLTTPCTKQSQTSSSTGSQSPLCKLHRQRPRIQPWLRFYRSPRMDGH